MSGAGDGGGDGQARGDAPGGDGAPIEDAGWLRLDVRVVGMHLVRLVVALAPIAVVLALGGELSRSVVITVAALFGTRALGAGADVLRWRTTRYRITGERVELRSGLLQRSDRAVPRDRVRTVNLTAKPLHRLFGLTRVEVGTGRQAGSGDRHGGLVLDAVAAVEADRLREELLTYGSDLASHAPRAAPVGPAGDPSETVIARLRWRWLPYDLLSPWTLALPIVVLGGGIQLLDTFGVESAAFDAASDGAQQVETLPLALGVAFVAGVLLVVGVLAAAALFVESWWGFALTRERGATIRVRRGLLTSRSISIEQRRLRGVELTEPLLLRAAGGASLHAIVTGLRTRDDGSSGKGARSNALVPSVPRAEAERVAAEVLAGGEQAGREPASAPPDGSPLAAAALLDTDARVEGGRPTSRTPPAPPDAEAPAARPRSLMPPMPPASPAADAPFSGLCGHPTAARRRRFVRAGGAVALLAAALAAAGLLLGWIPDWSWLLALAFAPAATALALDAYRALGHRVTERHLVSRHGALVRRTAVLDRDGVIGWTLRSTPFQRRADLLTLTATTAAGSGGYRIVDVGRARGLDAAEETVPGLLEPFLERSSATSAPSAP